MLPLPLALQFQNFERTDRYANVADFGQPRSLLRREVIENGLLRQGLRVLHCLFKTALYHQCDITLSERFHLTLRPLRRTDAADSCMSESIVAPTTSSAGGAQPLRRTGNARGLCMPRGSHRKLEKPAMELGSVFVNSPWNLQQLLQSPCGESPWRSSCALATFLHANDSRVRATLRISAHHQPERLPMVPVFRGPLGLREDPLTTLTFDNYSRRWGESCCPTTVSRVLQRFEHDTQLDHGRRPPLVRYGGILRDRPWPCLHCRPLS